MTTTVASDHPAPGEYSPPSSVAPVTSAPARTPSSRLGPEDAFPEDLTGVGMAELQVLHSRITRQLDHDYRTDPHGPHCCTLDRCQELEAELDTRDAA